MGSSNLYNVGLESQINQKEGQIKVLQKDIEYCRNQIKGLSSQTYKSETTKRTIQSHRKEIANKQAKIKGLRAELAKLRTTLKECKKKK